MQAETDTTYNGWTNYETWSVALIVDNDEGTYNERRGMIRSWAKAADTLGEPINVYEIASELEEWVRGWPEIEAIMEGPANFGLALQLLSAALSSVNWYEIAENWVSELDE